MLANACSNNSLKTKYLSKRVTRGQWTLTVTRGEYNPEHRKFSKNKLIGEPNCMPKLIKTA